MKHLVVLVLVGILAGCASGPKVHKSVFDKGAILVLPARDVVQNGNLHEMSAGSGKLMTEKVTSDLEKLNFVVVQSKNPSFSHNEIATKEAARAEAQGLGVDYCLQIALGEFRNAAPMTFRSDFVTLDKAVMFNAKTGEDVWRLEEPILLEKTNLGNHLGLIEKLGETVAMSISE